MKRKPLFFIWLLLQLSGAGFGAVFLYGIVRDGNFGDAIVNLTLGAESDWNQEALYTWRSGRYCLYLTTVNHETNGLEENFAGKIEVKLVDPEGGVHFQQTLTPDSLHHPKKENMQWTTIKEFDLPRFLNQPWWLQGRVIEGDGNFQNTFSRILLRRLKPDAGMGGLINYAMIFPAFACSLIAGCISISLAKSGSRIPLVVSCLILLAFLSTLIGVRLPA